MKKEENPCYSSCCNNYQGLCTRAGYKERKLNPDNFSFRLCPFSRRNLAKKLGKIEEFYPQDPIKPLKLRQVFRKGVRSPDGFALVTLATVTAAYIVTRELIYRLNALPNINHLCNNVYESIDYLING